MESKRRRWRRWLKTIENEVITLHWNRTIHRRIREIVLAKPEINYPNAFHEWIHSNYIAATAIRLRRLTEKPFKKYPNLSVQVLLLEIAACPHAIPNQNIRRFYRYAGGKPPSQLLKRNEAGELEVDPVGVKVAISRLEMRCERVGRFADKYIAHHDRKRSSPPKLDDVDKAIEAVAELFNEVSVLLTGRWFGTFEPSDLTGWEDILRVAWVGPATWQEES